MHISLTPELESRIRRKVESGMYNNASEVVREALRFMEQHEDLVYQIKLEALRKKLAEGDQQAREGQFVDFDIESIIKEVEAE